MAFLDDDPCFDPETVAERGPSVTRFVEIDDHGDALLFDSQRRHPHDPRGLHPAHGRAALDSARAAIERFFRTIAAQLPPPPPFAEPPLLWGTPEHVESLFAGTGLDLEFARDAVDFRFESAPEAARYYEAKFGPVIAALSRSSFPARRSCPRPPPG